DKLFLGVDSFNIECGLSTPNIEEANINQAMLSMAGEVVAVFDSSKVNKRSFAFIAPVDKIDVIVTDSNFPANVRTQLRSMNIKVYTAGV
ncbi:MAG: DeoR/GlpR transcriptional regulator, partial [Alistipes sp.]|nr:DeoR/GlpR transcriptional regulator [Alistipes sp.]